ncbi:hypothetical protein CL614_10555 [archaeon]|jgi:hypothetical protein|nr:hypothetical protein [archaeon]
MSKKILKDAPQRKTYKVEDFGEVIATDKNGKPFIAYKNVEKKESNSHLTVDAVALMEQEWPEMTKEFKRLQREQYVLFCRKQHDYGPGNISVGTPLQTQEDVKLSLTGLWFRINDKIQRVKTLLMGNKEAAINNEPIEDAFLDMSNYGIMATIVKNGKWGK